MFTKYTTVILLPLIFLGSCGGGETSISEANGEFDNGTDHISIPSPIPTLPLFFKVLNFTPDGNSYDQPLNPAITVTFSHQLSNQELDSFINLTVDNPGNEHVSVPINIIPLSEDEIKILPTETLDENTIYRITLSQGLPADDGLELADSLSWVFTTSEEEFNDLDCMDDSDKETLTALNEVRSTPQFCGGTLMPPAGPLTYNCQLEEAARRHSVDMANNSFSDHIGTDGSTPEDRVTDTGYVFSEVAENIVTGSDVTDFAIDTLLISAEDCKNIMNGNMTNFATAIVNGNEDDLLSLSFYRTHVFASPN